MLGLSAVVSTGYFLGSVRRFRIAVVSLATEHGSGRTGSLAVALSELAALHRKGNLLRPGWSPCPLHWQAISKTTGAPEKSWPCFYVVELFTFLLVTFGISSHSNKGYPSD